MAPAMSGAARGRHRRLGPAMAGIEACAMTLALVTAGIQVAAAYGEAQADPRTARGLRLGGVDVGLLEGEALRAAADVAAQTALDRPLVLRADEEEVVVTPRRLGAVPVLDDALASVLAIGRRGDLLENLRERVLAAQGRLDVPVGYRFAEERALDELTALAPRVDRPSVGTRLDLERRRIEPARAGSSLLAYDSLSAVAIGLAHGADAIDLVVEPRAPVADDPLATVVDGLDVSTVLGSFDTPYLDDATQRDRNHNLKVGAAKLDGAVLMPGETFSFNDVVGPRTAEEGFRYAPGITAGELVDVVGGGICQVSSTIFGAAFFAGLDVVDARPHTRPSSYVDMGLDSTVVYPSIDLELKNPFDFPVVFHMTVSQGKVRAEVLGARRPYQVAFERSLTEVVPFDTVWRDDGTLLAGTQAVSQRGMRGFKMKRKRKLHQGGQVVREEVWDLSYPPTTEIRRRGTNPSGKPPEDKPTSPLRDPAPALRIMQ
jgi:hypothetical protein